MICEAKQLSDLARFIFAHACTHNLFVNGHRYSIVLSCEQSLQECVFHTCMFVPSPPSGNATCNSTYCLTSGEASNTYTVHTQIAAFLENQSQSSVNATREGELYSEQGGVEVIMRRELRPLTYCVSTLPFSGIEWVRMGERLGYPVLGKNSY